ncbi:MAG TPA: hypothetical protein PK966_02230 [Syntrophorhabdaceae bacterium]|jgi:hypothetical protein|nr:hypothetical protein [Syntrophorhabdaceae bacterium]
MKKMKLTLFVIFLYVAAGFLIPSHIFAVEIEVQGEGKVKITQDISSVQYKAKKEAINKAITMAINKILGADAINNPKVQQKFDEIISQTSVYTIRQTDTPNRDGDLYIVNTKMTLDETKFRKLISDMGIALGTSVVRQSAIITIVDEFFTTPSDLNNPSPLREVTVYKRDRDSKYKEGEALSAKASDDRSLSKKNQESASLSAKEKGSASYSEKSSGRISTVDGSASGRASADAKYSQSASVDAKHSQKSSLDAASSKRSSLNYGHFVDASSSDHEFFTNIKEYQPKDPKGTASKNNATLAALQSSFQTYDIKILENSIFRSKFFGNQVITIDKLENSADLANYAKYAKTDAKADFFAIGTSVIVDRGINQNTNTNFCDGMVTVRVYATTDSESIASGALTESASGSSPDQCRVTVAKKIGEGLGRVISNKIQDYWKARQMYGAEFIVVLVGDFRPMERIQFTETLKKVDGVKGVKLRSSEPGKCEFVITYGGSDPLSDAIYMQAALSPIANKFSNYDFVTDGNQIIFQPIVAKVATPEKKQPAKTKKGKR